uniref:N-acetyltransferase domain-containing protein n=1 Tax=Ganoderma boninense TaxID=34458 RepID=A0A5K1K6F4_9APHY|nr:Uncharacterized protein [Ganoderma boninense]
MAPLDFTLELVAKPTECLAEEAIEMFSGLMGADPCSIALTGGNMSLLPDFGGVMVRSLMLTPGASHVYTARDENGTLVGFTIFALPGQLMCSTDEQRQNGRMVDYMNKLSPEGGAYFAETMGKDVPKANDETFRMDASERNTYWCNLAMVRADHQGKGIAKAMFELAFTEAAKTGAMVALTTTNIRNVRAFFVKISGVSDGLVAVGLRRSKQVPIYEKIGLKLYGERKFSSPWVEWTLWFFARESQY